MIEIIFRPLVGTDAGTEIGIFLVVRGIINVVGLNVTIDFREVCEVVAKRSLPRVEM